MTKVLVLYYSSYGHIEKLAEAIAEGARSTGAQVDVKRVPETVPEAVAKSSHFKLDQAAPVARSPNSNTTTPSSLAPARDTAACRRRWLPFWTRPAACGCAAHSMARSARPSPPRPRSMAGKR